LSGGTDERERKRGIEARLRESGGKKKRKER
jgi:hypothetical protein